MLGMRCAQSMLISTTLSHFLNFKLFGFLSMILLDDVLNDLLLLALLFTEFSSCWKDLILGYNHGFTHEASC